MNGSVSGPEHALIFRALVGIKEDTAAMTRLALASILGHGEGHWVLEVALKAFEAGAVVRRESAVQGAVLVDLCVDSAAIEFKSTFSRFGVKDSPARTEKWLSRDVRKMQSAGVPGYVVLTMATVLELADGIECKHPVAPGLFGNTDPLGTRLKALEVYAANLEAWAGRPTEHLDLGVGELPGGRGRVHFDVFLTDCTPPSLVG